MQFLRKPLLLVALLVAAPAFAQQAPPTRVGRVSIVEGTLAFYQPGDTDWSATKVNYPVPAGGWFATDPQSQAELRVGSDAISLSADTQINFADLRAKAMQIAIAQGRIDLHLPRLEKDQTVEADTSRARVCATHPGVYDIDNGGPDPPTRVFLFEGP